MLIGSVHAEIRLPTRAGNMAIKVCLSEMKLQIFRRCFWWYQFAWFYFAASPNFKNLNLDNFFWICLNLFLFVLFFFQNVFLKFSSNKTSKQGDWQLFGAWQWWNFAQFHFNLKKTFSNSSILFKQLMSCLIHFFSNFFDFIIARIIILN